MSAARFDRCIDYISEADDFGSLIADKPMGMHRLTGQMTGQWAMNIGGVLRLVIMPDATYSITIIVEIVDYHRRR